MFLTFLDPNLITEVLNRELMLAGPQPDLSLIRASVRSRLHASVEGTQIPGLRAAAAPIFDLQGHQAVVLSVIASETFPRGGDDEAALQLLAAAREVTLRIGGRWPEP